MGEKDYAIVVGITRYPDLGNLEGPEADALDFFAWLVDPKYGDVPEKNITKLLSSNFPEPATPRKAQPQLAEITLAFDELVERVDDNGVIGDRLYLYFAGHGFSPSLEDVALLMANAAKKMTGYHIPSRKYANWFRQAAYFKEVILFMDCCREAYQLAPPVAVPYPVVIGPNPAKRYFAFATQWSRAAREGPWGDNGSTRGLFTLAILSGLRGGAAADANGQIAAENLESYVFNFVRSKFNEWDKQEQEKRKAEGLEEQPPEEHPDPEFDYNKMDKIVFNAPPAAVPAAAPAAPAVADQYTVRIANKDGHTFKLSTNGQPQIPPVVQLPDRWEWHVDAAGLYKVTRDDGASKLFEVIGEKKETIDVSID